MKSNVFTGRSIGFGAGGAFLVVLAGSCGAQPAESIVFPVPSGIEPLTGPWVVAVQPGHWKIDELPEELIRLRSSSGTAWGKTREVDVNRAVADELVSLISARGWTPVLLPATVPPGFRADAFLSIHADGASDTSRRGWKLAPPWRSSPAGLALSAALSDAFKAQPDLVHDEDGITINMRGYFAFSPRRFDHAASPYTPSSLVELGFLSNAKDRQLLLSDPKRFARILMTGLEAYFAPRSRLRVDDLAPREFPRSVVGLTGVEIRSRPRDDARLLGLGSPGTLINPVGESGEWYEVSLRNPRIIGWVPKEALLPETPLFSPF